MIGQARRGRVGRSLVAAALCVLAAAPTALGADRIYWSNGNDTISYANLDGSGGGGELNLSGATPSGPRGLAVDLGTGRIYWANQGNATISFANLDGSGGGGELNISGTTPSKPHGLAIDPAAGRIYWANDEGDPISFANLDGSGGAELNTAGATPAGPYGAAIDPATGRIYWANRDTNTISYANLDGSGGGGELNISGATASKPHGVAIDPAARKIYWTNIGNTISYANLDGSGGGGELNLSGSSFNGPLAVAIDPTEGRIYWANLGNNPPISFANLDGSGGAPLNTSGATSSAPRFVVLVRAPLGTGAPAISGGWAVGSMLSCSQGSWAPDLLGAFLYRAPQAFAYQWSRDGADIPGATDSIYTAFADGSYTCRVTASNQAGSTPQTSAPHTVGVGPARFLGSKSIRVNRKGRFGFSFHATPGLNGRAVFIALTKVQPSGEKRGSATRVTLARRSFIVPADSKLTLRMKLSKKAMRALKRKRKIGTRATVTLENAAGLTSTASRRITLKAAKPHHR
jgi:DNA-binding beta-propeller fold protein YncE